MFAENMRACGGCESLVTSGLNCARRVYHFPMTRLVLFSIPFFLFFFGCRIAGDYCTPTDGSCNPFALSLLYLGRGPNVHICQRSYTEVRAGALASEVQEELQYQAALGIPRQASLFLVALPM